MNAHATPRTHKPHHERTGYTSDAQATLGTRRLHHGRTNTSDAQATQGTRRLHHGRTGYTTNAHATPRTHKPHHERTGYTTDAQLHHGRTGYTTDAQATTRTHRQHHSLRRLLFWAHKLQLNPFMPSGLFNFNFLDRSISNRRGIWLFLCPPTSKKFEGHTASGMFVRPSVRHAF